MKQCILRYFYIHYSGLVEIPPAMGFPCNPSSWPITVMNRYQQTLAGNSSGQLGHSIIYHMFTPGEDNGYASGSVEDGIYAVPKQPISTTNLIHLAQ